MHIFERDSGHDHEIRTARGTDPRQSGHGSSIEPRRTRLLLKKSLLHRVGDRIAAIFGSLYGCQHRRKAFPITIGAETYVVCLGCGRRFAYDWHAMQDGKRSS